ncbi:hypothetical protein [Rufibacter sp. LB8]|uniref:hypothetical protein n=1 Tax=Rufibacter sp. LB8 TaxID=2777781 RepID=UPI00178C462F|nr:hypothetical protein [Rufibacter sp. LB8]
MKSELLYKLVFIWSLFTLMVNAYYAISAEVGSMLLFGLIIFEAIVCWIAYKLIKGKKWALVTLVIIYGLQSVNIYTDNLKFFTKSGYNIELAISDWISFNVFSLLILILLANDWYKRKKINIGFQTEEVNN